MVEKTSLEYVVYICTKCGNLLTENIMGKKCFKCGEWTYNHLCKTIVIPKSALVDQKAKIRKWVEQKKQWHKGECRNNKDCSICLFLKEFEELK